MGNPHQLMTWTTLTGSYAAPIVSGARPDSAVSVREPFAAGHRRDRMKVDFSWAPVTSGASLYLRPLFSLGAAPSASDPNGFGTFTQPFVAGPTRTGNPIVVVPEEIQIAAIAGSGPSVPVTGNILIEIQDTFVRFEAKEATSIGGSLTLKYDVGKP